MIKKEKRPNTADDKKSDCNELIFCQAVDEDNKYEITDCTNVNEHSALDAVLNGIAELDEELFPANVWGLEAYRQSAGNDYDFLIAALKEKQDDAAEQKVIGFALLRCFDDAEIIRIAVCQSERKKGIGKRLLMELLNEAEKRGIHDMILEVRASNEAAKRLYESAGFMIEGIRRKYYCNPTEDAVIMRFKW